ncbi:MAG: hypothetical protein VX944_06250 [Myxococcota bacterium]|nr:hypothetical protein [Myxococcota bacterium]MEC9389659.1 hypothetical protein [Myxococcota bacterium]
MKRPLIALAALLTAPIAQAKDLRERTGVGFNAQFGHLASLSVRYGLPTPSPVMNIQVEGLFGLDTAASEEGGNVAYGARVLYGFLAEDNMNLFAGGGLGGVNTAGENTVRLQPAMGADFFLFGLENLGFTVEWGINMDIGKSSGVSTTAAAAAGAHYWF